MFHLDNICSKLLKKNLIKNANDHTKKNTKIILRKNTLEQHFKIFFLEKLKILKKYF